MNKKLFILIALLIAGGIVTYQYFQQEQAKPALEALSIEEVAPPTPIEEVPEPQARQVLNEPEQEIELPPLESSDDFMTNALANLLNNKTLMTIFSSDQLIHNIVVTIDNLPRKNVSMRKMPIKKAPEKFITMEHENEVVISPKNNARYAQYVEFAKAIEPKQLVSLYVQLYPLFQAEYESLGYPDQYFNDRLMIVIDHLLATPEVNEPVKLTQPKHFYLYADEALENRSIGQRILMRIGSENATLIKTKLSTIKQELMLHLHEEKIE